MDGTRHAAVRTIACAALIASAAFAVASCHKWKSAAKAPPSLREIASGTTCGEARPCEPGEPRNARITLPEYRFSSAALDALDPASNMPMKIVVDASRVTVVGDPYPIANVPKDPALGLAADDKAQGRDDRFVTPLFQALTGAREAVDAGADEDLAVASFDPKHSVIILADRATPYRLLTEVLFTASMAGLSSFYLAVTSNGAVGTVSLPRTGGGRQSRYFHPATPSLFRYAWGGNAVPAQLGLRLGAKGIEIAVGDNLVAKGCNGVGEGPAIPRTPSGELDFKALAACAKKIHDETKDKDSEARVGAEAGVPFGDIVTAMDAIHGDASTGTLYDAVWFTVSEGVLP